MLPIYHNLCLPCNGAATNRNVLQDGINKLMNYSVNQINHWDQLSRKSHDVSNKPKESFWSLADIWPFRSCLIFRAVTKLGFIYHVVCSFLFTFFIRLSLGSTSRFYWLSINKRSVKSTKCFMIVFFPAARWRSLSSTLKGSVFNANVDLWCQVMI